MSVPHIADPSFELTNPLHSDETPCIFTTAVDRTLKAYSLGTYELLDSFPLPSPCLSFAQHPLPQYRRFVACAMMDGSMAVLDLVTREVEAKVQDHTKVCSRASLRR